MRNPMSAHDLSVMNTLVGLAMLDDQVHEKLLSAESRVEIITSVPLSLGASEYLDSLESAPDLNTFAMWVLAGTITQPGTAAM